MVDAVRYLVDNGAKWRAMPVDLPAARKVYDFFRRWSRYGYVRELYQRLRRLQRTREGRAAEPSAGIMDAQSVDGSETCPAATRGVDGNKLRDGRKRHILTDTSGLLLEVTVTPANVHDSVAAPELIEAFMAEPGRLLKLIWADTAYQGPALAQAFAVGLESPTSGSVAVNGKPSAGHRRPLAEVGALLEARAVHTLRSARNHLLAMAATAGISTNGSTR